MVIIWISGSDYNLDSSFSLGVNQSHCCSCIPEQINLLQIPGVLMPRKQPLQIDLIWEALRRVILIVVTGTMNLKVSD
ncbi:hypothetical protein ILYODFUR_000697 [Ilyodon furcidens]|uniref:Uncharacterized protein n=1 Tax=Ilyodon furcidens TaxID=33524 RepID=A0ABV0VA03_9TELE